MTRFEKSIDSNSKEYIDKRIYNYGSRMSSTIVINDFWLCLFFGFSMPHIKGKVEKDTVIYTYGSLKKKYRGYGTEMGICFSKVSIVGGVYYTNEQYEFEKGFFKSSDYNTDMYFIYLGVKRKIFKNVLFGCEYNLTFWNEDILDPDTSTSAYDYHGKYTYHDFHMGLEKPFKGKKIFDIVALRSGIIYSFENIIENYNYPYANGRDVLINNPMEAHEVKLSAGIGFQKNIFCVDLFVNVGNWDGMFTGPRAASVTLTIGLSQEFLKKDRLTR